MLYKLLGTQRVRAMTAKEALGCNALLKNRGSTAKWLPDPTLTNDEITEAPLAELDGANFTATLAKSIGKAKVVYQQLADQETAMKKAVITDGGARKAKGIDGRDLDDNEWRGNSMCQLIRFCGSKGKTPKETMAILNRVGFAPAKGTISIQLGKGRKLEKIPNLSREVSAELLGQKLPPPGKPAEKTEQTQETAEAKADRKAAKAARKAAKRAKAHALAGHKPAA